MIFFQLFKRAHPPKRVLRSVESDTQTGTLVNVDRLFFHNLPNLVPSAQPVKGQWKSLNRFEVNFMTQHQNVQFCIIVSVYFPDRTKRSCRTNDSV